MSVGHGSIIISFFLFVAFDIEALEASNLVFPRVICLSRSPSVSPERHPTYSRKLMDMPRSV